MAVLAHELVVGVLRLCRLVHHRADGADHLDRVVALEDVAAHVHSGRSALDGAVGHRQSFELGQLAAARHDHRHGTARGHGVEVFGAVVGLDYVRAELSADPHRQAQVPGVSGQLTADRGDRENRHAGPLALVHQPGHVAHRLGLELTADENLDSHRSGIEPQGIIHRDRDVLIGHLFQHAGTAAGSQDDRRAGGWRDR